MTDCATGDVLAQESKAIKLYSIYDYKTYSDEFGVVQNDNLLAWMTPDSDGVLAVRRNAISWLENNFGRDYGKLPGYQYSYGFVQGQEAYVTFIRLPRSRVPSARWAFATIWARTRLMPRNAC